MNSSLPILYSFRRCPYAIRARMALAVSHLAVELREVDLKRKPPEMIDISPKATVPVLKLVSGEVIDESLEIIDWALTISDPDHWLLHGQISSSHDLILLNDGEFKKCLDHYKYADRFPESPIEHYRKIASDFPSMLNDLLHETNFLVSDQPSLVDIAIFPFIRQFAFVDKQWFDETAWSHLQQWLEYFLNSQLFLTVMKKYNPWKTGDSPVILSPDTITTAIYGIGE